MPHQDKISGDHWLFTSELENTILQEQGYFIQKTIQFHWNNFGAEDCQPSGQSSGQPSWQTFDDFLKSLKQRKRKNIKKERKKVQESGLVIQSRLGSELSAADMEIVYELYLSTILKKHSQNRAPG